MAWEDATSLSAQSPFGVPSTLKIVPALNRARLDKKQRSIEKAGMVEAYRRSVENSHAFQEHSDINRQKLQQNMAVRGLGQSSISDQQSAQFERDTSRQQANLDYNAETARQRLGLYRKQQAYKRRMGPLLFIDTVINKAAEDFLKVVGMGGASGVFGESSDAAAASVGNFGGAAGGSAGFSGGMAGGSAGNFGGSIGGSAGF